ncbi:MAG: response regulator transcription factor [Pseudomonadota bacterium]
MTAALRIIVVEDDAALAAGIVKGLRGAGFDVELFTTGDQALEPVLRDPPDLVVLDLMLPGRSGLELLEAWQGRSQVPVLVLTARTELDDRLRCFSLGAADYLPKPFWMEELLARIRTRLRVREEAPPRRVAWADVVADLDGRRVLRGVQDLGLTAAEFNVLAYLLERPGRALSRGQIARAALSVDDDVDERTVDSHLARVRKKLGGGASQAIGTVWGIGYRFQPEPAVGENA